MKRARAFSLGLRPDSISRASLRSRSVPKEENVLGYLPWPYSLKRAKIFVPGSSGTSGLDSIQRRSWFRSWRLILRSRIALEPGDRELRRAGKRGHVSICGTTPRIRSGPIRPPAASPRPDVPTLESGPRAQKKRLLFLLAGFNSQLDELDQNAVVAQPPAISQSFQPV